MLKRVGTAVKETYRITAYLNIAITGTAKDMNLVDNRVRNYDCSPFPAPRVLKNHSYAFVTGPSSSLGIQYLHLNVRS